MSPEPVAADTHPDPVEIGKVALIAAYDRAKTYDDPLNFDRIMREAYTALEAAGFRIVNARELEATITFSSFRDPKHLGDHIISAAPLYGGRAGETK